MHLTNYAINKHADGYEEADEEGDEGHKRSLGAILNILESEGADITLFMSQLKDAVLKTVITAQPQLAHLYRVC